MSPCQTHISNKEPPWIQAIQTIENLVDLNQICPNKSRFQCSQTPNSQSFDSNRNPPVPPSSSWLSSVPFPIYQCPYAGEASMSECNSSNAVWSLPSTVATSQLLYCFQIPFSLSLSLSLSLLSLSLCCSGRLGDPSAVCYRKPQYSSMFCLYENTFSIYNNITNQSIMHGDKIMTVGNILFSRRVWA